MGPIRCRGRAVLGIVVLLAVGGCLPSASPAPSEVALATLEPVLGLTWTRTEDVELPADAFAIPSQAPSGPAGPGTAGHPGHFPGQAVIEDVAVVGDRLVAVGYAGLNGDWRARAWSSSDGLRWTIAPIDETHGSFGTAITTRADGTLVAVGRAGPRAAAWTSPDGVIWRRSAVAPAGSDQERMTTVVAIPDGFLAGGSAGPELGERHAIFWHSPDGSRWTPIADSPAFDGAEVAAIARTGTGFVALGRLGTGQRATGSIAWRSTDGATWSRVDDPALRDGLAVALTTTSNGLLAVGSDADEREAVVWISLDGASWTRAPEEASRLHFGEKIRMTDVIQAPNGFVAIGNYVGVQFGTGTSWLSTDGLHWTRAPDQPTFGQAEPEAIAGWHDSLVMVGSRGAPDNYIPSVWLSPGLT